MKFLAGLSIVLVLSVVSPTDTQAFQYNWGIDISPSARMSGMGEAGVAVVGQDSHWYNPASLGFWANDYRITTSFFPVRSEYLNLQFLSATASLARQGWWSSPVSVGLSACRTELELPGCCGYGFRTKEDAISLGVSRSGDFSFGAGVTYKSVKMRHPWDDWFYPGRVITGDAFDVGVLASFTLWPRKIDEGSNRSGMSVPFRIGLSWSNLDGDLEREGHAEVEYDPLWETRRTGLSLGVIHSTRGFQNMSVLLAFEYEEVLSNVQLTRPRSKVGVEVALAELLTLRAGNVSEEDHEGRSSAGLTLSTKGLTPRTEADNEADASGGLANVPRKLVVEFSIARRPEKEVWSSSPFEREMVYRSLEIQWLF